MASKEAQVPGIGTVHLYKRRGSRSIRLSFTSDGDVRVSLPQWVPYQAGIDFAAQRRDWISSHRPAVKSHLETHDRIGKAHTIIFRPTVTKTAVQARVANNQIVVRVPYKSVYTDKVVQEAAQRGAHKALRLEAERLLPQRLRTLAETHGFTYRSVYVKRLRTRWGSCSSERDIILNFYLMQLPWDLIDYVLLHELTHTVHMHHGTEFWAHMENVLPGAKLRRKQLKTYQTAITPA